MRYRLAWIAVLAACLCGYAAWASPRDGEEAAAPGTVDSVVSTTGASGRFTVISSDKKENILLLHWLETTSAKIGQLIGRKIPFEDRGSACFVLHRGGGTLTNRVDATEWREGGRLMQRMVVYTADAALTEEVQETLCQLMMNRCVQYAAATNAVPARARGIPYWLSEGVSQNVLPEMRARNYGLVYAAWRQGLLLPLARLIETAEDLPEEAAERRSGVFSLSRGPVTAARIRAANAQPELLRAFCGMVVDWIISMPRNPERFERIFARVAAGARIAPPWVSEDLAAELPGGSLEEAWDRWMMQQRRKVFQAGVLTPDALEQFRLSLLLYPGECGIPLLGEPNRPINWREAVVRRDEAWVPVAARNKGAFLRVMATGRGKELGEVVEKYGSFLDALAGRKRESYLKELLKQAEAALRELELSMRASDEWGSPAAREKP